MVRILQNIVINSTKPHEFQILKDQWYERLGSVNFKTRCDSEGRIVKPWKAKDPADLMYQAQDLDIPLTAYFQKPCGDFNKLRVEQASDDEIEGFIDAMYDVLPDVGEDQEYLKFRIYTQGREVDGREVENTLDVGFVDQREQVVGYKMKVPSAARERIQVHKRGNFRTLAALWTPSKF